MKRTDFLDVTFDLRTDKYRPYRKPNNSPLYIHSESNHPPTILEQLPAMIADRISGISCDRVEFDKAKEDYNNSLKSSGLSHNIEYNPRPPTQAAAPRQRKRNIIWFNPPYNVEVTTSIGSSFLALMSKHFPQQHKYHKIFNKNTIKVTYTHAIIRHHI